LGDIPFPFLKRGVPLAVIYAPAIRTARVTKRFKIGPYEAHFLDQIAAGGSVKSHFLSLFEGLRHTTFSNFKRLGRRGEF
jgi:hypothetical protein